MVEVMVVFASDSNILPHLSIEQPYRAGPKAG